MQIKMVYSIIYMLIIFVRNHLLPYNYRSVVSLLFFCSLPFRQAQELELRKADQVDNLTVGIWFYMYL